MIGVTKQWLTSQREDDSVHVIPLDDVIVHDFDDDCSCGPSLEYVDGNANARLFTHHSLDGREFSARVDPESRP